MSPVFAGRTELGPPASRIMSTLKPKLECTNFYKAGMRQTTPKC